MYSSTTGGSDQLRLFHKLKENFRQYGSSSVIVLGGDWNCTTHFLVRKGANVTSFSQTVHLGQNS